MPNGESRFKVVITDYVYPSMEPERRILEPLGVKIEEYQCKTEDDVIKVSKDADVLLNTLAPITRRVISELDKAKAIVRHGIGYDNVDVEAATEKGIMVVNVPQYGNEEVADHTIALILTLVRKIPEFDKQVKEGRWKDWVPQKLRPIFGLENLVLGVIGLGTIGRQVARKAKEAFRIRVIAYDPYVSKEKMKEIGVECANLETLFKSSDIVTIHTALTKETHHLIDEDELRLMKKTAYLVNAARGSIVNNEALYKALKEGWIAGAALDTMEREPPDSEEPLLNLENIIITPHVAGYSEYAVEDLLTKAAQEVLRVITGNVPLNLINKEVLRARPS